MAPSPSRRTSQIYTSTAPRIYHAASAADLHLTYEEIEAKILEFYEDVCRHISVPRRELSTEGKTWLAELLTWEHLFPNNKDAFPGIRPVFKNRLRKIEKNGLPFCECCACLMWEQGDSRCPLTRIGKCEKGVHEDFKFRIGSEVMGMPVCAGCEEEKLREEGWVTVPEGMAVEEGDGWMMVAE